MTPHAIGADQIQCADRVDRGLAQCAAIELCRAGGLQPDRLAKLCERRRGVVAHLCEELTPALVDCLGVLEKARVELSDEAGVGASQEGRAVEVSHAVYMRADGRDCHTQPLSTSRIVVPIAAGDWATTTPALRNASILSPAPPLPPVMIAPA